MKKIALLFGCISMIAVVGCAGDTESDEPIDPWEVTEENEEEEPVPCMNDGRPICESGCGSDEPICVGGEWECPTFEDGGACPSPEPEEPVETVSSEECENSGAPMCNAICGEASVVCVDGEWVCEFTADETCETDPDEPEEPDEPCMRTSSSTLDGVSIEFIGDRCRFTLEELENGIEIPYLVEIENGMEVVPMALDAGGCGTPDATQLNPLEVIGGDGQKYCLCDVGLCGPSEDSVRLQIGMYAGSIEWEGRNWSGPSDTGNSQGAPFPPGTYEASVSAAGTHVATETDYAVTASLQIQVEEN